MTETQTPRSDAPQVTAVGPDTTGWVGWIFFAGILLWMVGFFQIIAGIVAIANPSYFAVKSGSLVVHANYTGWGWVHLAVGVTALFAGYGVMVGRFWARVFGISLAGVSAVVNLAFMQASPVWSVLVIGIDVLSIYALAVHGGEAAQESEE
jgi:hypothetical protein